MGSADERPPLASREEKLSAAFVTLADTLIDDFDLVELLHTLVQQCAEILDTESGGLMLADASGQLQLLASTSEEANLVEVMQLAAGAGPCVDCFRTGSAVTVGDIETSASQWPEFRAEALKQGFRSAHATPMRLRGQVLGTLNLFSTTVGELGPADVAAAQALADVATIGILQERGLRQQTVVASQLQYALDARVVIEQAKGVVSETANVEMKDTFDLLRGYARDHNMTLGAVAAAVVERSIDVTSYAHRKSAG